VHAVLSTLSTHGLSSTPRFLGMDEVGREILTFLPGRTRTGACRDPALLHELMAMLRSIHDVLARSPLRGGAETVCHNDVSPRNTVFADDHIVGLIDWDNAAPGRRIDDVAYAAWQFLDLQPGEPAELVAGLVAACCDAYDPMMRQEVMGAVLRVQLNCASEIEARAAKGGAAYRELVAVGAPGHIRADHQMWSAYQDAVDSLLNAGR
jgi:aminoglycoside phosphotransferase (APT) family kinase protein